MKIIAKISDYLLLGLSLTACLGALVYYFYALNWLGIIITLLLSTGVFWTGWRFWLKKIPGEESKKFPLLNSRTVLWAGLYLLFFSAAIIILLQSRSDQALISPWEVVSRKFFFVYLAASASLLIAVQQKKIAPLWKLLLISAHYFLSFGVAVLVYKIGYGFDPFIHQATMELITKTGAVEPKPPYYLGQYSLIIIIHKLSGLSIYFLNKFLVLGLAAIYLPITIYRFLLSQSRHGATSNKFLTIIFLLSLTFAPFIATTPQNLSYLFLILVVFLGLSQAPPSFVLILSLAAFSIHPLSGLPAIFFTAWLFLKKYQGHLKLAVRQAATGLIFLANSLAVPAALFFSRPDSTEKIAISWTSFLTPLKGLIQNWSSAGREDWLLNLVYLLDKNLSLWLGLAILGGLIYFYRYKRNFSPEKQALFSGLVLINLSLLIAYLLSSQIVFNDLIHYEQASYASRLLIIIVIFSLPLISLALNYLIKKIKGQTLVSRLIWFGLGLAFLMISLYVSYPRFDRYFNSHGYSTSQADCRAVKAVAETASQPYIALANQQVSAAALKEQGFDHYYQTDQGLVYFYPIPTGGPLYQYYLDMAYKKPSRETMNEALDLAGVDEGYLIINRYWYQSGRIINAAKLTADSWQMIDNGAIYIFKYQR